MPIITIHAIEPNSSSDRTIDQELIAEMVTNVREAGARALNDPPDNLWVHFEPIKSKWPNPPYVTIKALQGRPLEMRKNLMRAVSSEVAKSLSVLPGAIWIHYQ